MIKITDEDLIELAFKHYRKVGFPYERLKRFQIMQIFKRLQETESRLVVNKDGLIQTFSKSIELSLCGGEQAMTNTFHPHIWDSYATGMSAPTHSFNIDKRLKKCARLSLTYENEISDSSMRTFLKLVDGTQVCSNFRPSAAKAVYDYFEANDVLDMSTGYGGRLMGFLASKAIGIYTGVDPSKETCLCNQKIAKFFKQEDRVNIICSPFEETKVLPQVDLAFTSPPYFAKEVYVTDDKNQSREKFPEYDAWVEGFLRIVAQKTYKALRKGGHMAINIADVRMKNKIYPLVNDTIKVAKDSGFNYIESIYMIFGGFGANLKKRKAEPILVFRKD